MAIHIYNIVGTKVDYRGNPASAILEFLSVGTPLTLAAEPDNKVDPNAIAVWIKTSDILPTDELESAMLSLRPDFTLEWLVNQRTLQLGYIPAIVAARLQPFQNTTGTFAISAKGGPQVRFTTSPV